MGIITKEVEVKLWGNNIKHYHGLGYEGKHGDIIVVKTEDLPDGSNIKIQYLCDYCEKEIITITYADYIRRTKEVNKMSCKKCYPKKVKETNLVRYGSPSYAGTNEYRELMENMMKEKYGVRHYSQTQEYKEKWNKTCEGRYGENYRKKFIKKAFDTFYEKTGYRYPSQSPEVREKIMQSCINHYGVSNPQLSFEVRERTENTNLERYDCIAPSQSDEVKMKAIKTNLENYGYKYTLQVPEVREKITQSLYNNSSQKSSKQQRYINNLYQGILNYPVKHYNVDIYLPNDNFVVEYNGGGHALNIVMGRETEEEHSHKEIIRYNILKREGYKQMTITSRKDKLPSDTILLQMLQDARTYFNTTYHTWTTYDIDKSLMFNAENKDGLPYDFGELRTISKTDISEVSQTS